MGYQAKRFLFWTPRILCIGFVAFVSLFALDVFEDGAGLLQVLPALLIHLIPTAVLTLVLFFSWRWEWVGAIFYSAVAVLYMIRTLEHPLWIVTFSGPLFLIALLFLFNWIYRSDLRGGSSAHERS